MASRLLVTLNARLRPPDRSERFEHPLQEALDTHAAGSTITGGGTLLTADREPAQCDLDLEVVGDAESVLQLTITTLEAAGAPKGSQATLDDAKPLTFGITEGLAVYLNGTDLPTQVYAANDINDLIDALHHRLNYQGRMYSFWEGPRETALYLYGTSAARMGQLIVDVLVHLPLAQGSRVVPLPCTLPSHGSR